MDFVQFTNEASQTIIQYHSNSLIKEISFLMKNPS